MEDPRVYERGVPPIFGNLKEKAIKLLLTGYWDYNHGITLQCGAPVYDNVQLVRL